MMNFSTMQCIKMKPRAIETNSNSRQTDSHAFQISSAGEILLEWALSRALWLFGISGKTERSILFMYGICGAWCYHFQPIAGQYSFT